jgi:hypothetical protein
MTTRDGRSTTSKSGGANPASLAAHSGRTAAAARRRTRRLDGHFTARMGRNRTAAFRQPVKRRADVEQPRPEQSPGRRGVDSGQRGTHAIAPSPPASKQLSRSIDTAFGTKADTVGALAVSSLRFRLVLHCVKTPPPHVGIAAHALLAAPFGHNAPLRMTGPPTDRSSGWASTIRGTSRVLIGVAGPSAAGAATVAAAPVPDFTSRARFT